MLDRIEMFRVHIFICSPIGRGRSMCGGSRSGGREKRRHKVSSMTTETRGTVQRDWWEGRRIRVPEVQPEVVDEVVRAVVNEDGAGDTYTGSCTLWWVVRYCYQISSGHVHCAQGRSSFRYVVTSVTSGILTAFNQTPISSRHRSFGHRHDRNSASIPSEQTTDTD